MSRFWTEIIYVSESASVLGKVRLCNDSSVWFGAILRGDTELITIGEGSNVQDGSVLHTDLGFPLTYRKRCDNWAQGYVTWMHYRRWKLDWN